MSRSRATKRREAERGVRPPMLANMMAHGEMPDVNLYITGTKLTCFLYNRIVRMLSRREGVMPFTLMVAMLSEKKPAKWPGISTLRSDMEKLGFRFESRGADSGREVFVDAGSVPIPEQAKGPW